MPTADAGVNGSFAFLKRFLPSLAVIRNVHIVVVSLAVIITVGYFGLRKPQQVDLRTSDFLGSVSDYANEYHWLYVRWTFTDWLLTFFAAGTAVSAAIKNAYSVKQDKQDTASWLDLTLMVLAVLSVLATTFDAKVHADQLADQYRAADLRLQDAEMQFIHSSKDGAAQETLFKAWEDAHTILEQKYPQTRPPQPPPASDQTKQETNLSEQNSRKNTAGETGKPTPQAHTQ